MPHINYRLLIAMPLIGFWRVASSASSTSVSVLANASSSTASTTGSSTTPLTSSTLYDSQDSFWFPLIGLSDDSSIRWGVNVSKLDPQSHGHGQDDPNFRVFEIVVNDTNLVPSGTPEIFNGPNVIDISNDTINQVGSLVVTTNGDPTLVLGLNSSINYTRPITSDDLIIPSVPFGLNYGHYGIWNGSITFGGVYDANRVASSSWTLISESALGNSTFLQNGTLNITASLEFRDVITTFPTILDINEDALILPSSYVCSQALVENLIVGIPDPNLPNSTLKIVVPSNLTSSASRCVNLKSHDPHNNRVILGRPFFQASYIYVDRESHVYITAAHQYDLDISALPFDANATMTPAQQPAQPADSPSDSGQKSMGTATAVPFQIEVLGICLDSTIISLVATLILASF